MFTARAKLTRFLEITRGKIVPEKIVIQRAVDIATRRLQCQQGSYRKIFR